MHATMDPPEAISPNFLPPVANPCGQTICTTSFGPAWQEKVQLYVGGIGRVNIFDQTRRLVHIELTSSLPVGLVTPSDHPSATIRVLLTWGAGAGVLSHLQLDALVL